MTAAAQRGAGLVELGIAVLVISIASLGLFRAQLAARESGFAALQRSQAVWAGESLLEIVRSAPVAPARLAWSGETAPHAPAVDCGLQSCDNLQWVQWNLVYWWRDVAGDSVSDRAGLSVGGLLGALACIGGGGAELQLLQLELRWRDGIAGSGPEPGCDSAAAGAWQQVTLSTRLSVQGT